MKYINFLILLSVSFLFFACSKSQTTVFLNGKIHTMDKNNSIVEAIAVKDGKIVDLGKNDEIKSKYGKDKTVDLEGKTVLPGFIESEGSLVDFSLELARYNNMVDLRNLNSIDKIVSAVSEKVKNSKEDSWVGGYGWNDENIINEIEKVNKNTLDNISARHFIYLINSDGTIVWCNSKTLEAIQITNLTPSPEGGEIGKDDNGELEGLLFGKAINLVKEKLPKFTKEDMQNALANGANEILKYGITSVVDRNLSRESINAYKELIDSNKVPIYIYAVLTGGDDAFGEYLNKGIETDYKKKLTVRAVTLDYDGAFELQSAAMSENYKTDSKKKNPYTDDATIEKTLRDALDKNFQFTIKTVGDDAVSKVLNIIEKVVKEKNPKDARIKLENVEFVNPGDLNRIKELKIIPSVRPESSVFDLDYINILISPSAKKNFALWNTFIKNAGMISSGSGFPFSHSISPIIGIYYLTTRQPIDTVYTDIPNPEQKISIDDAVKSYTVWAAYSIFQEENRGSLEKGKTADMVVLSEDIFNLTGTAILNSKVVMTVVNGIVAYDNKEKAGK